MYYKMRILPVIFLFSMMTKAQDNFILGFLIHGVNLILNKGMTGIWIARRYWLFFSFLALLYQLSRLCVNIAVYSFIFLQKISMSNRLLRLPYRFTRRRSRAPQVPKSAPLTFSVSADHLA